MILVGSTVANLARNANLRSDSLGGKTVTAYPDKYISTPLKNTMFSLGVKEIDVGPRIERTNADGSITVTRLRNVKVTFGLNVYAPHSDGGEACTRGFDRWIDFIVRTMQLNISGAGCSGVEYEQSIGTNVLKGYFIIENKTAETVIPE